MAWDTTLGLDTTVRDVVTYRPIGHMPTCHESRDHLVQTALKLFATRGYHAVSIADILKESGCTRGLLYYYFSSKEDLGYAVIDEWLRHLRQQGAASCLRTSKHPIDRLLWVLDNLPSVLEARAPGSVSVGISTRMACVHEGFGQRLGQGLEAMVDEGAEMVRKGVADGQIVDGVDPEQLAHVVATMSAGVQHGSLLWEREVIWQDALRWLKEYLNSLRR